MQSLTQLNNYSNTPVSYVDLRPPEIKFDRQVPTNQSTTAYQTKSFSYEVVPGIEITSIVSGTATYSFDLSSNSTMYVAWPSSLPDYLTTSVAGQLYSISGIGSVADWNLIRSPTITGTASNEPFTFNASITFESAVTSWTTAVSIISLNELSAVAADANYYPGVDSNLRLGPKVVDNVPGFDTSEYVLTITADDNSVFGSLSSTSAFGGTSVFAANTLTISGSLSQVNSHLDNLKFLSSQDLLQTWTAQFSLYNPTDQFTSRVNQYVRPIAYNYVSSATSMFYDRNQYTQVSNYPIILDELSNPTETFTAIITPTLPPFSFLSAGSGGLSTSGIDGVLTITGTKNQVNSHLASLSFQPALNSVEDFAFKYSIHVPAGPTIKFQQWVLMNNANAAVTINELSGPPLTAFYIADENTRILSTVQIVPASAPFNVSSYTLTIIPSQVNAITIMSTTGTGGTSTFNNSTKALTIVGTKDQINSHLSNLYFTSSVSNTPFTLTYSLFNSSAAFYSTQYQTVSDQLLDLLTSVTSSTYLLNTPALITGNPLIKSDALTNTGSLTFIIYPGDTNSITFLSSAGNGGTSTFNNSTKALTIVGTKDQINSHLSTITITTAVDYSSTIGLRYRLLLGTGQIAQLIQSITASATNTKLSNSTIPRSFVCNTANQLVFPNQTPQILEVISGAWYTIYLSTTAGFFGTSANSVSANYTFSGTRDEVNSVLSTIMFYPNRSSVGSTQMFTYQQYRNSAPSFTQDIVYTGTPRSTPIPGAGVMTFTTNTVITLTYEQLHYLEQRQLWLLGGGGGGGSAYPGPVVNYVGGGCGGGGGGGYVKELAGPTAPVFDNTTLVIVVGDGGIGSQSSSTPATSGGTSSVTSGSKVYASSGGGPGGNGTFTTVYAGGHGGSSNSGPGRSTPQGGYAVGGSGDGARTVGYTSTAGSTGAPGNGYVDDGLIPDRVGFNGGFGGGGGDFSSGGNYSAAVANGGRGSGSFGNGTAPFLATAGSANSGGGGGGGAHSTKNSTAKNGKNGGSGKVILILR